MPTDTARAARSAFRCHQSSFSLIGGLRQTSPHPAPEPTNYHLLLPTRTLSALSAARETAGPSARFHLPGKPSRVLSARVLRLPSTSAISGLPRTHAGTAHS